MAYWSRATFGCGLHLFSSRTAPTFRTARNSCNDGAVVFPTLSIVSVICCIYDRTSSLEGRDSQVPSLLRVSLIKPASSLSAVIPIALPFTAIHTFKTS